jgi:DNA polymerase I
MKTTAFDSETKLIEAGNLTPDMVCLTYCGDDHIPGLLHARDSFTFLQNMLRNDLCVGANVAYDMGVIAAQFPELLPDIFTAYFDDRVRDCQLDQMLIDLAQGRLFTYFDHNGVATKVSYSLGALNTRYGFPALDKSGDSFRLRYGELIDVPVSEWPAAAVDYAKDDALATFRVHQMQKQWQEYIVDGCAQARAAFGLQLMSIRGMVTDLAACEEYIAEVKADIERCKNTLLSTGILRPNGSRDTKKAKEHMQAVCTELGVSPKRTAKDGISLDAEACRDSGDEVLKAYATFGSAKTILEKTELLKLGATGTPLQTSFTVMVQNGRTSSREPSKPLIGTNFQNIPRAGKMRECFVPREGFLLCSVDYNGMELHTFAQVEIWATGRSLMAEALNAGKDLHCMLAATMLGCSYEEVVENKKSGKYKAARQLAKIGNFGLIGGMGAKRFLDAINKSAASKEERVGPDMAAQVKRAWEQTWQPKEYFAWINNMLGEGGIATVKQFVSGRIRAHCDYSVAANAFFSGLAADAAKSTLLPLWHEALVDESSAFYGSFPLLYIHDEVLAEVPIATAHEAAMRQRDLMIEQGSLYCPDVPLRAEPALMDRWYKAAEAVYDNNGRLIPWQPPPAKK